MQDGGNGHKTIGRKNEQESGSTTKTTRRKNVHMTGRAANAQNTRNESMHVTGNVTVPIHSSELSVAYVAAYAQHSKARRRVRVP